MSAKASFTAGANVRLRERRSNNPSRRDIGSKHERPQPQHSQKRAGIAIVQEWKDRRQRILGEQLLASEDDNQKAGGISKLADQVSPSRVRQPRLKQPFDDQREAHGQSCRHAG
jgi:polyphosphate kinase 2 (PPK2 family)